MADRRCLGRGCPGPGGPMASTILVVDNDPVLRTLVSRVLTREGHHVRQAEDGMQALADIAVVRPDLLITDLVMPRLTGWSLFARVRRRSPRLPIIIMSGSDTRFWQQERELADQAVFLRKPFALDQLLATVARLLAGTRSESI